MRDTVGVEGEVDRYGMVVQLRWVEEGKKCRVPRVHEFGDCVFQH